MRLVDFDLKKAIYTRLTTGDYKIDYTYYDTIPENAPYPYLSFGSFLTSNDGAKSVPGEAGIFTIDAWDSLGEVAGSDERITDALNQVMDAITFNNDTDYNPLTLTNHNVDLQKFDGSGIVPNIDDKIKHGYLRIKFQVSEK